MQTAETVAAMPCPICKTGLTLSDRQGVEIDFCPTCRGVWLDRGELDKSGFRSKRIGQLALGFCVTAFSELPGDSTRLENAQGHRTQHRRCGAGPTRSRTPWAGLQAGWIRRRRRPLSPRQAEEVVSIGDVRLTGAAACVKQAASLLSAALNRRRNA